MVVRATHRRTRFEVDGRSVQHTAVLGSLCRHALTILDRLGISNGVLGVGGRVDDGNGAMRCFAGQINGVDLDGVARDRVHHAVNRCGGSGWRRAPAAYPRADLHGFRSDRTAGRSALRRGPDVDATAGFHVGQRSGAELGDHRLRGEVHRRRAPVSLGELDRTTGHRSDQALDLVLTHRRWWRWWWLGRGTRLAYRGAVLCGVLVVRCAARGD